MLVAGLVAAVFAIAIALKAVIVVPKDSVYVVERLGRYHATLTPGRHVLTTFIDAVRFRYFVLPREEQLADRCITLDNVAVSITSTFRWQVADAEKAAYASASPADFVRGVVQAAQRTCIGERPWKDLPETTRELQQCVLRGVAGAAAKAGLKIADHDVGRIERV